MLREPPPRPRSCRSNNQQPHGHAAAGAWRLAPRPRTIARALLAALSLLLALLAAPGALASRLPQGGIETEQALTVFADGRQEIITNTYLEDSAQNAAVIFPVPGVPEVDVVQGADLFTYLDEVTDVRHEHREELYWREPGPIDGGPPNDSEVDRLGRARIDRYDVARLVAHAPATLQHRGEFSPINAGLRTGGGVDLLGRAQLDRYDVARLAADDSAALQRWLDTNGYQTPAAALPILQTYTDLGWSFVAVRLADQPSADGPLRPLRMAFASERIVYPMRLGALAPAPLDVELYVLAEGRVEVDGLETRYAGPVDQLDQAPPAALAPLFRAPYLTRLRNAAVAPATLTDDFVARPAPTDEPFRATETRVVYVSGWQRLGGPIGLLAALLLLNIIGIGAVLWLRRRMQAVGDRGGGGK